MIVGMCPTVPILGLQEEGEAAERWDEAVAGRSTKLDLAGWRSDNTDTHTDTGTNIHTLSHARIAHTHTLTHKERDTHTHTHTHTP